MSRVTSCLAAALLLVALCLSTAWGETRTVFAKRFDKPKGGPLTYQETLLLPYQNARYTLRLTSGYYGTQEAKNVSVLLNDVEIVDSAALRSANPVERAVAPLKENDLTVTLKGQGGNFVTVELICDGCTPIRITSPLEGEYFQMPTITVQGELGCSADGNTGVIVNGVVALVDGTRFVANHVPPQPNGGMIKADLVNGQGAVTASAQIITRADTGVEYVTLQSDKDIGLAPFDAKLTLSSAAYPIARAVVTCTGPAGDAPVQQIDIGNYTVTFSQPGLYTCTADAYWGMPEPLRDTIGIYVQSKETLDALLQAKWGGMKAALAEGEVEKALTGFLEGSKAKYRNSFTRLQAQLPTLAAGMRTPEFISAGDGVARYRISRDQVYNGENLTVWYDVYFARDAYGIWKIDRF